MQEASRDELLIVSGEIATFLTSESQLKFITDWKAGRHSSRILGENTPNETQIAAQRLHDRKRYLLEKIIFEGLQSLEDNNFITSRWSLCKLDLQSQHYKLWFKIYTLKNPCHSKDEWIPKPLTLYHTSYNVECLQTEREEKDNFRCVHTELKDLVPLYGKLLEDIKCYSKWLRSQECLQLYQFGWFVGYEDPVTQKLLDNFDDFRDREDSWLGYKGWKNDVDKRLGCNLVEEKQTM
jgi:hypothetical protein